MPLTTCLRKGACYEEQCDLVRRGGNHRVGCRVSRSGRDNELDWDLPLTQNCRKCLVFKGLLAFGTHGANTPKMPENSLFKVSVTPAFSSW